MSSLVEELQRDSLNANVRVSDLLRKAKAIAVKLELPDLAGWVETELNGYGESSEVPKYRIRSGRLKGRNPYHGWQPVIFPDAAIEDKFSKIPIGQSVAELEHLVAQGGVELMCPLNSKAKQLLMRAVGMRVDFSLLMNASDPVGILDAVRNALLEWSLKLEQAGIKGEGMSFSREEREKAHETHATYNIGSIGTFTGNMGSGSGNFSVDGNTVNADTRAAISSLVDKIRANESQLDLDSATRRELGQALDGLQSETKKTDASPSKISTFLAVVRGIAEKAAGSLAAQGILYEIHHLMH